MLETVPRQRNDGLTPTLRAAPLFGAFLGAWRFWLGQAAHRGTSEFPRRSPGSFLAAVNGVAEHSCYCIRSAQKVNLKTMGLLFRALFCIDSSNV